MVKYIFEMSLKLEVVKKKKNMATILQGNKT